MRRQLLVLAIVLAVIAPVTAQQPTIKPEDLLFKPGDVLVAAGDLNLRDAPPHGWFYRLGEAKATLKKGDQVKVTDEKTIKTLFGEYQWAEVTVLSPQGQAASAPLWVYIGEREKPLNLRISATK